MNLVQPRQTRSIAGLLSSVLCSAVAVALLTTVLGKQVFDMTGSSLALGFLGLAEFAPAALLVFVTGTLADRFDRRRLASIGLGLQAVTIAALAWYAGTNPTSTVPIFILVIAFGTAGAFATPATRALPADIMMPERLPWLVARQTAVWQGASIVGPVLGGVLYVVNVRAPYIAGTVFLVAAAAAMMFVSPSRHISTVPRPRRDTRSRGRCALRALATDPARRDLPRPLCRAVRRRGRAPSRHCRRPPRCRCRRARSAARRDRDRRGLCHAVPHRAAGAPARRAHTADRGRAVRARDDRPGRNHQLRRRVHCARRALGRRLRECVHSLDPRAVGHAAATNGAECWPSKGSSSARPTSSERSSRASWVSSSGRPSPSFSAAPRVSGSRRCGGCCSRRCATSTASPSPSTIPRRRRCSAAQQVRAISVSAFHSVAVAVRCHFALM